MRLLLLLPLLAACPGPTSSDDDTAPTLTHTPPSLAPELDPLPLVASVTADGEVTVTLHHRLPGATDWSAVVMTDDDADGSFTGTVPSEGVQFPTVEYWIEADAGAAATEPLGAPEAFHTVTITDRPAPSPAPVRAHWSPDTGAVDLSWANPQPLDVATWSASVSAIDGSDPTEVCTGTAADPMLCGVPGEWGSEYMLWTVTVDDGDGGAPAEESVWTENLHLWLASWAKQNTPEDPLPFGTGAGEFNLPMGVLLTTDRVMVVEQSNHRVQLFDRAGTYMGRWGAGQGDGSSGNGNSEFNSPSDLASDRDGHVLVADFINGRVEVFQENGTFQRTFGSLGAGDGQLRFPASLTVDGAGMVHVAETTNHRVSIFSVDGAFQSSYNAVAGVPITSDRLRIRWVESIAAVAISHDDQILFRPDDGSAEWAIDVLPDGALASVQGLCETAWGEIIVAIDGNQEVGLGGDGHRFVKLDPVSGTVLGGFGDFGDDDGFFLGPVACDVDEDGTVYAVDSRNHRIQIFGP